MNIEWGGLLVFLLTEAVLIIFWGATVNLKIKKVDDIEKIKEGMLNRPDFKYVDETFARKDVIGPSYSYLIDRINDLEKKLDRVLERMSK